MTHRILIVDDDPHIREVVRFALSRAGYEIFEAADGRQARTAVEEVGPDLVILDIVMPELDGSRLCTELRADGIDVPIIFLSSRDTEVDLLMGLELGGDDYLTKPFSPRELVARVKAVLRRTAADSSSAMPEKSRNLCHGRLSLDMDRHEAFWDGQPVILTVTELGILRTLMGRSGKVYRRQELIDGAYDGFHVVSDRTVNSHVRRVRRKFQAFGADPIETVRGARRRGGEAIVVLQLQSAMR